MGPRKEQVLDVLPASGRDVMLSLDLSGSMEREDFNLNGEVVSRLSAVQAVSVAHVVETSIIGISGKSTAIADGIGLAIKRLREREAKSRVIILLSDGQDTSGNTDPVAAAEVAADYGIRIYTIALGPMDLESTPSARDAVDTETLRDVAEAANGKMFRVKTTDDLRAVTAAIDALEPSPSKAPPIQTWRDFWIYPGGLAVLLLATFMIFGRKGATV